VAGQPELTQIFRRSELRQLKQRVSCICKLEPLSLDDLREYLRFRLTRAGLPEQTLFPEPAIQALHEYSHGIPRLVNTLCDAALRTGFAVQAPTITLSIIREAAKDLELAAPVDLTHLPLNGDDRALASSITAPATPVDAVAHSTAEFGPDGNCTGESRVPRAGYASRQKEQGFLAGLGDRWQ